MVVRCSSLLKTGQWIWLTFISWFQKMANHSREFITDPKKHSCDANFCFHFSENQNFPAYSAHEKIWKVFSFSIAICLRSFSSTSNTISVRIAYCIIQLFKMNKFEIFSIECRVNRVSIMNIYNVFQIQKRFRWTAATINWNWKHRSRNANEFRWKIEQ